MHPAYSVIFFTVSSGTGFGLLALLGLAPLFGVSPAGGLGWAGFIIAYGLCVSGLLSSTRHLGHPERAWRAFSQWRSSWLSREGVLAVATLIVGGVYALLALFFGNVQPFLGALTAVLAVLTVHATAMIYAQLKTVQRWNTPLTVGCYQSFALSGGALVFATLLAMFGEAVASPVVLALIGLCAAAGNKLAWWRKGDTTPPLSTPESATGLGHLGQVRMFEPPHTGSNYLLKEMGYRIGRKHRQKLRRLVLLFGFALPVVLCLIALSGIGQTAFLLLALVAHLAGMLVERWLFFAEAEHSVMTYYTRAEAA
jgi:DMSO reductase anchor subunit